MVITMSNCMVTGGPLLVTNKEGILVGVMSPLGGAKISKSLLPPSAGGKSLNLDQMTGELHWDQQMYDEEQSSELNEVPAIPEE